MCEQNSCCNNAMEQEIKKKLFSEPETVPYKEYKNLLEEYNKLDTQLKVTKSDLDCKIELMSMLQYLIINKGSEEMIRESTIKTGEIILKYNKA